MTTSYFEPKYQSIEKWIDEFGEDDGLDNPLWDALRQAVHDEVKNALTSAKHGLLRPTDLIEPYEQRLPSGPARREWGKLVATELDSAVPEFDAEIVVLAGSAYADAFEPGRP